ncbi:DNA methyltransferase [Xanthobacter autotrophicus DSM 597]|uniref:DNA-methyltransferase n=1 Tax=Xanthobacter wiegelii TaxID=3119913 RepID=UPI0037265086
MTHVFDQAAGERFSAYCCDTVEFTAALPDSCLDFSIYSPPFSSLYVYSESERDMGNVESDDAFFASYRHLVRELLRVTKPGRLTAIHVKDLVYYSNSSDKGDRGLRDFTGGCIRAHVEEGWTYHRRVTIDRCPVREMQKTKSDRLLYKNFRTDGARTGGGLPEYLVVFRAWKEGMENVPPVLHDPAEFPLDDWQALAQPVWMAGDIWRGTRETDTLNVRVVQDDEAEKHLCPMPLDITERGILQYTNRGDTVYSPFMGIGSEGYVALKLGRRFLGTELKPAYFAQARKYLAEAERLGRSLFEREAAE